MKSREILVEEALERLAAHTEQLSSTMGSDEALKGAAFAAFGRLVIELAAISDALNKLIAMQAEGSKS